MLRIFRPLTSMFAISAAKRFPLPIVPMVRRTVPVPFKLAPGMQSMRALSMRMPEIIAPRERNKAEFKAMFQFIQKSRLRQLVETFNLEYDYSKLQQLKTAIEMGDAKSEIFADKHCHLYLLYLLKENQISFSQGITTYTYLMSLMQTSDKQRLRPEDEKLKHSKEVEVLKLVHQGRLTPIGKDYLLELCENFKKEYHIIINFEDLSNFIISLPPSEQWLLKIENPKTNDPEKDPNYELTCAVVKGVPFLRMPASKVTTYCIPSISLMNHILQKCSVKPIKMISTFGRISEKTLRSMHEKDEHPLTLYSLDVVSNPKEVHNYRSSALTTFIHDIYHALKGTLLSLKTREMIYKRFIPFMEKLKEQADQHKDQELVNHIEKVIHEANDFNDDDSRYFFANALFIFKYQLYSGNHGLNLPIGDRVEDRFLYLINQFAHNPELSQDEREWWQNIVGLVNQVTLDSCKEVDFHRRPTMTVKAILAAANESSEKTINEHNVDWKAFLELVETYPDSAELWKEAKSKFDTELTTLISAYNLKYFHPYQPLTEESRKELIQLLESKIQEQAENTEKRGIQPGLR